MTRLTWTIFITLASWVLGTTVYGYYWITSILSEPGVPDYERGGLLPALGFAVYRLPYLLIGLVIIIALELLLVPGTDRKPASMV
jgi:hypothetical protein